METTQPTTPATGASPDAPIQKPDASEAKGATPVISSDFETFLKMLTAQMRHQDPLNPVDSNDFATQLATFSSVEQQVLTNDLLKDLNGQMSALGVAELAQWVGMEARAVMPVQFDGSPVQITTEGSALADRADLVVRDTQGAEVQRQQIDPARTDHSWAGVGADGSPLPAGTYDVSVESFSTGQLIETRPVIVLGRIVEARNEAAQPVLVMDSGQEVESSQILGLRAPS